MTFLWDMDFVYRAYLVILRLGALLFFLPVFQARGVPSATKAGFAILLGSLVAMVVPAHPPVPAHAFGLLTVGLGEVLVGLMMGLMIRAAFQTVYLAGELIGQKAGFMRDPAFDPISQQSEGALERLLSQFAVILFFALGLHLHLFSAFVHSFQIAQLGQWLPSQGSVLFLIQKISDIFGVAVQIAAPFIAINFVINMTFAVLGKAAPQMNVFVISFAVMIVAGLLLLVFGADVLANHFVEAFRESAKNMLLILRAS